jgi:hypothetical protein
MIVHDDVETGKTCNTILTAGIPSCWYRDDVHDQTSHSDDMLQREGPMGSPVRDLTQSEILAVRSGSKVRNLVMNFLYPSFTDVGCLQWQLLMGTGGIHRFAHSGYVPESRHIFLSLYGATEPI